MKKNALLTKAILYRVVASLFTFSIAYFITHQVKTATLLGATDVLGKLVLYYLYEVVWNKFTK